MSHQPKEALNKLIKHDYPNIAGVAIFVKDELKYEYYADGYGQESTIHVASVTKSILSLLIGIAIEQGAINSVEDKVLNYFPSYTLKRGEKTLQKLTIKHLLTMTAPYKFTSEPYTKVYSSEDWTTAALDLLGGKRKIGVFQYTTVGIQVLSGILVNATKQAMLEYAKANLFKPLGIDVLKNITIQDKNDYLSFIKGRVSSGWMADPKGINTAGWGLTLTTMDMAKIGRLCLNKGLWQGQQIVSSEWIKHSVSTHSVWGNQAYGFLWWVIDNAKGIYAAIGDGGNIIYVSIESEMVVAISSEFKPRAKDRIDLINKYIAPIFS